MEGADLVREVFVSMPGASIPEILEKTNEILNTRVVDKLPRDVSTVFHILEYVMDFSEENVYKILRVVAADETFPVSLRNETQKFIDSQLFNSISKFMEKPEPVPCCWFRGRSSSSKT
jgi:hypothetical protein